MKKQDPLFVAMRHALRIVRLTGRFEMLPDLVDAIKRVESVRRNPFFSYYTGNDHVLRLDSRRSWHPRNNGSPTRTDCLTVAVA